MKKVLGEIHISHSVTCPQCNTTMWDDMHREWWNENITDILPDEEAYKEEYQIKCMSCDKEFLIEYFIY